MSKVLVFAGTSEGRAIAEYLNNNKISCHVCVATPYGESLLPTGDTITSTHERMDSEAMQALIEQVCPELIIDATHPYAVEATNNIKAACQQSDMKYLRLLRNSSNVNAQRIVNVDSIAAAVAFLETTTGNILATTGSKELFEYTKLKDYQERVYARVLSLPEVVAECAKLEFTGKNLLCMQGPFSKKFNQALIEQLNIKWLVTKEAGQAGGFAEKYEAAIETKCNIVLVGRPTAESGITITECKKLLCEHFSFTPKQQITLVGIGMGTAATLTKEGQDVVAKADLLIGAKRMLAAVADVEQVIYEAYRPDEIKAYIEAHPEYENIVIVLSGDVGFYSGAKKLLAVLGDDINVVCGISSLVYFCAKVRKSWEDVLVSSIHGRQNNLISLVKKYRKVFTIIGNKEGVSEICQKLVSYEMDEITIYIGENLSYENEKITTGLVKDFVNYKTDSLSVMLIENSNIDKIVTHGISDEEFIRDKVPMTKEEIRSISLSKLRLTATSIVYDVGAGTGSVAIEMAKMAFMGRVYAVEKKDEAITLLNQNKQKFATDNLTIIEGLAPKALVELPPPTHAFIGGSSGNLKEIMELLLDKNPQVRIVINCITLETLTEAVNCLKSLPVIDTDIVQVSIGKAQKAGTYHLMIGANPISIISCQGGEEL